VRRRDEKFFYIPFVLAIAFFASGFTSNPPYCLTDPNRPHVAGAESVLKSYLDAVDRGELWAFSRKLERSEIIPIRVEYDYVIATQSMEIRVYSDLKEPFPALHQSGLKVRGVSATMEGGKIIETESHIWID
jgi:hypothetical protein